MKSACDRRTLLVVCLAFMALICVTSVTIGVSARRDAKAWRVEAEMEAARTRVMTEFMEELFARGAVPQATMTELFELRNGRLERAPEGPQAQQLREDVEKLGESPGDQD